MKKIFKIFTLSLLLFPAYLTAQTDETCGTQLLARESLDLTQQGGIYLTSQGELKVLVVFVRFKDDTTYHPHWPVGQPPNNYNTFIDPSLQTNSTHYINLTNYYKKMSLGVYKVTGQAVYVETPQNKSYYFSQPNPRFVANKDVLQNRVDPLINFAEYDNWSTSSNYNHQNQPDGTVDMIVMVWRGLVFADWWSGEASLGGSDPYPPYNSYFYVENGTKLIRTGFGSNNGSGVTVHYWGARSPERNFKVTVHEIGHWLLGSGHPYGGGNDKHRVWGMLTLGDDGICANTYERERVAWINPTPITGDILNAPLHDFVEYGTAYKYHPPNGATNEYYYFANHQKLSVYDNATSNPNDKGIFVIHQQGIYNSSNNIRVKTSTGQWNWSNPFNTNCWGNNLPAFKPSTVNRAGLNNRDMIPKNGGGAEFLFALINDNNQAVCGDWLHGGGLNNSFNLTYNDVFSPYSNPYTHTWSNSQNNFTMEVFQQNGSILNAKFYITNPLGGKPSKPQDLRITVHNTGDNAYPKLNWELNLEPDVISSSQAYLIERSLNGGAFTQIAMVNGSTSQYIDYSVWWAGSGPNNAAYKIRAKDTQGLTSLYSDIKSIQYGNVWKENLSDNEEVITEYRLQQNYPNPFNPVTNILYQLPMSGLVQLKVYDLLGSEVAVLVNELKSEGSYSVSFNASNLPSGVYIYSLRVNDFVQNNKMTLLK
jgi:hypothetical protein